MWGGDDWVHTGSVPGLLGFLLVQFCVCSGGCSHSENTLGAVWLVHPQWTHISASAGVHAIIPPACDYSAAVPVKVCHRVPLVFCTSVNASNAGVYMSYASVRVSRIPVLIPPPPGMVCTWEL